MSGLPSTAAAAGAGHTYPRLLLVEDDDGFADAFTTALGCRGFRITRCKLGGEALRAHRDADLIVLDLGLPDMSGLEVLRRLCQVESVPVLVLTARGDDRAVVEALGSGAADFVVKVPRLPVLLARINAILDRARRSQRTPERHVTVDDVEIGFDARSVVAGGEPVELTVKEFDVLAVLARNLGVAVSRNELLDDVWGDRTMSGSLNVHMGTLRSKLGRPGLIRTIHNFGYRLG